MTIDFGKTAQDYAQHRAGFPDEFFERLTRYAIGKGWVERSVPALA